MSPTITVTYSDQFKQKVESLFHGDVEVIKALQDGSPFLGEIMCDRASAIHDIHLVWMKEEMYKSLTMKNERQL